MGTQGEWSRTSTRAQRLLHLDAFGATVYASYVTTLTGDTTMQRRSILVLALLAATAVTPAGKPQPSKRITAKEFPSVSKRVRFFEERINSVDAKVRARVLVEVSYFFITPDREYCAFLKRLLRDPSPVVSGRALKRLYDMFVPIEESELPRRFVGYHDGQMVDLTNRDSTIASYMRDCRSGRVEAGYAAYVLGVLKHKPAAADLKKLRHAKNIFVRYAAGRALIACGDPASARAILTEIVEEQLAIYARLEDISPQEKARLPKYDLQGRAPWYITVACRTLMHLTADDREYALKALIRLVRALERTPNVNDQSTLHSTRKILAHAAGRWFQTHEEAMKWYQQRPHATPRKSPSSAPAGRAADRP